MSAEYMPIPLAAKVVNSRLCGASTQAHDMCHSLCNAIAVASDGPAIFDYVCTSTYPTGICSLDHIAYLAITYFSSITN
jgi:hypothetical protein